MRPIVWMRVGLLVLVALALLPFLVGYFLPEEFTARVQLSLSRPPEEVWSAISDFDKHPVTGAMKKLSTRLPDSGGLPVWVEDIGSSHVTVWVVEENPPSHQKRHLKDSVVPMTADWTIDIERVANGSRITATNYTRIHSGTWHVPVFRFIMTLTNSAEVALRAYWMGVARDFGETPQFTSP